MIEGHMIKGLPTDVYLGCSYIKNKVVPTGVVYLGIGCLLIGVVPSGGIQESAATVCGLG